MSVKSGHSVVSAYSTTSGNGKLRRRSTMNVGDSLISMKSHRSSTFHGSSNSLASNRKAHFRDSSASINSNARKSFGIKDSTTSLNRKSSVSRFQRSEMGEDNGSGSMSSVNTTKSYTVGKKHVSIDLNVASSTDIQLHRPSGSVHGSSLFTNLGSLNAIQNIPSNISPGILLNTVMGRPSYEAREVMPVYENEPNPFEFSFANNSQNDSSPEDKFNSNASLNAFSQRPSRVSTNFSLSDLRSSVTSRKSSGIHGSIDLSTLNRSRCWQVGHFGKEAAAFHMGAFPATTFIC